MSGDALSIAKTQSQSAALPKNATINSKQNMFGAKFKQNKKNVTALTQRSHLQTIRYLVLSQENKQYFFVTHAAANTRPNAAKGAICQISSSDSVLRAEKA